MTNVFEKTWFLGLGVLTMTRDKVTEAVDRLVEAGKVEAEESRDLVDELVAKGKAEQEELRNLVDEEIRKLHEKVGPVGRKEFEALQKQVVSLEMRVQNLEETPTPSEPSEAE